jgi:hypothetical protein
LELVDVSEENVIIGLGVLQNPHKCMLGAVRLIHGE